MKAIQKVAITEIDLSDETFSVNFQPDLQNLRSSIQTVGLIQPVLLMPFDHWLNRTFLVWATSMLLLVVLSLVTKPPTPDKIKGIIWSWNVAKLPESERERNRGLRNLFRWWCIFISVMAALYAYVMWFQFWGPGSGRGSKAASALIHEDKSFVAKDPWPNGRWKHSRPEGGSALP